jgi:N-glycosylase/DNA lyase
MLIFDDLDIDLGNTFGCGQNFRWKRREDGAYLGNVEGRAVRARLQGRSLHLEGARPEDEAFWRSYFDAESDYPALLGEIMDDRLRAAMTDCAGIRVLNQPFYETLCCFILSANNNIARITGIVDRFCRIAPEDENGLHAFPTPRMVLDAGRGWVDSIGAGYRASYLWEAAARMENGFDAASLHDLPYEEASRALRAFKGVGEKVADCILLFSCGHRDAFPVDTWVERILSQWYGISGTRSQMKKQAMARFGTYGGIAQQYLFLHAMRQKLR